MKHEENVVPWWEMPTVELPGNVPKATWEEADTMEYVPQPVAKKKYVPWWDAETKECPPRD